MRQEVTRAHKGWSLDSVMLYNDVTKWGREDITNPPAVSLTMLRYKLPRVTFRNKSAQENKLA